MTNEQNSNPPDNLPKVIKNKSGRPGIKMEDLPSYWRELMMQKYGEGGTDVEVRTLLSLAMRRHMCIDAFYRLKKEDEEFAETVAFGHDLAQTWWEQQGRENLTRQHFKFPVWAVIMRQRFNYKITDKEMNKAPGQGNALKATVQIYIPDNGRGVAVGVKVEGQETETIGEDDGQGNLK